MPEIIILIGLPGSGKSTYCEKIIKEKEYVIASTDNLIEEYAKGVGITYSEAWYIVDHKILKKIFDTNIKEAIKENKNIIVDRTNMFKKSRNSILNIIPKNYKKIAIIFEIPEDELKNRLLKRGQDTGKIISEDIVEFFASNYVPPIDKDFDQIIFIYD